MSGGLFYHRHIEPKGDLHMKLSEKVIGLRKACGMSQEELAEKLNVSRQAVSRWESGTAMPDANNILQISRLFGVTTDYLLNDDYQNDDAIPKGIQPRRDHTSLITFYFIILEVMILLMQFMATFILQNIVFAFLSFLPFIAVIGGFEYAHRKHASEAPEKAAAFRRRFYKISVWLGLYFPIRFLMRIAAKFYPRPYSSLLFDVIVLVIYICAALFVNLSIDKGDIIDG